MDDVVMSCFTVNDFQIRVSVIQELVTLVEKVQ